MAVLADGAPRDAALDRAALDAGLRAPVQSEAAFLARFPPEMPPVDNELRALGIDPDSFYAAMGDCSSDGSQELPGQVAKASTKTRVRRRRRGEKNTAPQVLASGWGMARGKAQRARAEVEEPVATVAVDADGVEELVLEDDCPGGRMAHEDVKFGRIVIDTLTDDDEPLPHEVHDEEDNGLLAENCTNFTLDASFDYDAPCSTAARGEFSDWVPMCSLPMPTPEDPATEAEMEAAARAPDASWRGLGASGVNDTAKEPQDLLEPFDPPLR